MIGKKTLESKPIPAAKVKEILEEFKENHGDEKLSYEQNLTLEHATSLTKLSLEDTEKLIEELETYFDDIETEISQKDATRIAIRIADILPRDMPDLRLIFAKERSSPTPDEMKGILEILEKYDIEDD